MKNKASANVPQNSYQGEILIDWCKTQEISDIKITDYKSPFVLDFIGLEVDEKDGQLGQIIENHFIFEWA